MYRRCGGILVVGNDGAWWKARVRCGVIGVADGDGSGARGGGSVTWIYIKGTRLNLKPGLFTRRVIISDYIRGVHYDVMAGS